MDVFDAVQKRSSVRAYTDEPVPKEKLDKVLEAGRLAPSARNTQPWHFVVVTDLEKRKILAHGTYAKFLTQSPVAIVCLGDKVASSDWYAVDVSLAVENMILVALEEGLGTCCVGSFDEAEVRQTVKAPDNWEVILVLALGYPKEKLDLSAKLLHTARPRKKLREVTSQETYGNPLTEK